MTATAIAQILANTTRLSRQDLEDFASLLDFRTADSFWAEVRKIRPTLYPCW